MTSALRVASSGAALTDPVSGVGLRAIFDPIGDALRADAVAYWKMEEASGTRADSTGNGNNLTSNNNVVSGAGKVGNGAVFESASSKFLSRIRNASLDIVNTDFSFAFWVKFTTLSADQYVLHLGTDINDQYYLHYFNPDGLYFTLADDYYSTPAQAVSINTWYFVIVSVDHVNKVQYAYVNNGTPQTVGFDNLLGSADPNGELRIGSWAGLGIFLNGTIDEVLFLRRLLTLDEREYIYNAGAGRTLYP